MAGVLAGKFGFEASSLYSRVARPVLHALYQRQNAVGITGERYGLTAALIASLTFLMEVLRWALHRQLDFATVRRVGIAYADAFFEMDGVKYRPGASPTFTWSQYSSVSFPNGWGLVVRCPATADTWYASRVVPERILKRFSLCRQYIFLLETLAQCLASWVFYYELG